jgi:hypothetical protein
MVVHYVNRSRNWSTLADWADHISWTQGKDRRAYLRQVILPSAARRRAAEPVPAA